MAEEWSKDPIGSPLPDLFPGLAAETQTDSLQHPNAQSTQSVPINMDNQTSMMFTEQESDSALQGEFGDDNEPSGSLSPTADNNTDDPNLAAPPTLDLTGLNNESLDDIIASFNMDEFRFPSELGDPGMHAADGAQQVAPTNANEPPQNFDLDFAATTRINFQPARPPHAQFFGIKGNQDPYQLPAWAPLGSVSPVFKYTPEGRWLPGLTFTADELRFYIDHVPRDLAFWVQTTPLKDGACGDQLQCACRWRECPANGNVIGRDFFRVAIDEYPGFTCRALKDPNNVAGFLHLHCMEQIFDPAMLAWRSILHADQRACGPGSIFSPFSLLQSINSIGIVNNAWDPWFAAVSMQSKTSDPDSWEPRDHTTSLGHALTSFLVNNGASLHPDMHWHLGDLIENSSSEDEAEEPGKDDDLSSLSSQWPGWRAMTSFDPEEEWVFHRFVYVREDRGEIAYQVLWENGLCNWVTKEALKPYLSVEMKEFDKLVKRNESWERMNRERLEQEEEARVERLLANRPTEYVEPSQKLILHDAKLIWDDKRRTWRKRGVPREEQTETWESTLAWVTKFHTEAAQIWGRQEPPEQNLPFPEWPESNDMQRFAGKRLQILPDTPRHRRGPATNGKVAGSKRKRNVRGDDHEARRCKRHKSDSPSPSPPPRTRARCKLPAKRKTKAHRRSNDDESDDFVGHLSSAMSDSDLSQIPSSNSEVSLDSQDDSDGRRAAKLDEEEAKILQKLHEIRKRRKPSHNERRKCGKRRKRC